MTAVPKKVWFLCGAVLGCVCIAIIWHWLDYNSEMEYFDRAQVRDHIQVDKIVTYSSGLFDYHQTVLFRTDAATIEKLVARDHFSPGESCLFGEPPLLSSADLARDNLSGYLALKNKPVVRYWRQEGAWCKISLAWDAKTGIGYLNINNSD